MLISKRHTDDLLGGLWELPGDTRQSGETLEECLVREVWEELGIEIAVGDLMMAVRHAYTHFRVTTTSSIVATCPTNRKPWHVPIGVGCRPANWTISLSPPPTVGSSRHCVEMGRETEHLKELKVRVTLIDGEIIYQAEGID